MSDDKLEKMRRIKSGGGIQQILDEAYAILKNPIIMFDTEYSLLAHTDEIGDDPISREIVTIGTFSYDMQKFFMEEGFGDVVADTTTVNFLNSSKTKYQRIYGKLYNKKKVHVANIVMVEIIPFDSNVREMTELLCQVLSREIVRNEFYQMYGNSYQETYLHKLLDGSLREKGLYTAHISILYNSLKSNLYLAVADVSSYGPERSGLYTFRELFRKLQPSFKYTVYEGYIILLIHTDAALDVRRDMGRLHHVIRESHIRIGISSRFENLFQLREYYAEAVKALSTGTQAAGGGQIFLFAHDKDGDF